jgi:hypothetical protein
MNLIALVLLVAPSQVVLLDEKIHVPAQESYAADISLVQRPALVDCSYEVLGNARRGVRLAMLSRAHLERFHSGLEHEVLAASPYQRSGHFQFDVRTPGEYALLVDNRSEAQAADVALKVTLVFHDPSAPPPVVLSQRRRFTIIALSVAFFLATAGYAVSRFRKANSADAAGISQ